MRDIPEIETEYSPQYRRINVRGVYGGVLPGGVEAIIYSEERRIDRVLETQPLSINRLSIKRTVECGLLIDPIQLKSFSQWLNKRIQEYETNFGRIPSPEEVESRSKRNREQ